MNKYESVLESFTAHSNDVPSRFRRDTDDEPKVAGIPIIKFGKDKQGNDNALCEKGDFVIVKFRQMLYHNEKLTKRNDKTKAQDFSAVHLLSFDEETKEFTTEGAALLSCETSGLVPCYTGAKANGETTKLPRFYEGGIFMITYGGTEKMPNGNTRHKLFVTPDPDNQPPAEFAAQEVAEKIKKDKAKKGEDDMPF